MYEPHIKRTLENVWSIANHLFETNNLVAMRKVLAQILKHALCRHVFSQENDVLVVYYET